MDLVKCFAFRNVDILALRVTFVIDIRRHYTCGINVENVPAAESAIDLSCLVEIHVLLDANA